MGEVAEMMLDGTLCQGCGGFLNEEAPGYPCYCIDCRAEAKQATKDDNAHAHRESQAAQKKVPCPTCGRRVKAVGLADHVRDSHAAATLTAAAAAPTPSPFDQYKPAFEKWANNDGTYHLAPGKWRMISNGGVPVDDHVRPYRQDRTMHTFEGFVAGLETGRSDLVTALREIAKHDSSEGYIAMRALSAAGLQ